MKNKFREELVERILDDLENHNSLWSKGFDCEITPINAMTKKAYNGLNRVQLMLANQKNDYEDNRWLTFKQIQKLGYRLERNSKGEKIEYYLPYNLKEEKFITWQEYNRSIKENNNILDFAIYPKCYTVFNGDKIVGLPHKEIKKHINEEEVIERVSKAMGVDIVEKKTDCAYYSSKNDQIAIPNKDLFLTQEAYNSTVLHELSHATGHEKRLNRKLLNTFGSEEYAYEELVAEFSSCFMGEYTKTNVSSSELDNHKSYIKSWIDNIKDNPNYLFKAIKQGEEASNYMIEIGHLQELKENVNVENDIEEESKEVKLSNIDKIIEKKRLEEEIEI